MMCDSAIIEQTVDKKNTPNELKDIISNFKSQDKIIYTIMYDYIFL